MTKMTVHNLNEVKALIKESFSVGDESQYDYTVWYSHSGELLCTSKMDHTDFELVLEDRSSITIEV